MPELLPAEPPSILSLINATRIRELPAASGTRLPRAWLLPSRMTGRWSCRLTLAAALFLTATGTAPADDIAPSRGYKVAVESNGEPFTAADAQGRATGFAVELLRAAAQEQKLPLDFEVASWPEIIDQFRQGRYDILSNVSSSRERAEFIDFSMLNLVQHSGIFARKGGPPLHRSADLAGKRVAVLRDSLAHDYARKQNWGATLVPIMSLADGIEDLRAGRLDAMLAMQLVALHRLHEQGYRDIVLTDIDCADLNYRMHFGVHAGNADLLWRINEGLLTVHANGTYDRLYEKWIGALQARTLHYRDVRPYLLPLASLTLVIIAVFVWQRRVLRRVSRQAEELRQSEERLQLVFEGSQDAFWDWDVPTDRVLRSPRWAAMLGYTLDEVGSTEAKFLTLIHPDDLPAVQANVRELWRERDHFANEFRMRTKSGKWKWILDRGKVISRDPLTRLPLRLTGTHSDITARKHAEEESARLHSKMLETQKLESLGVLAGGIAHDFNNLLTVILGNAALLRLDAEVGPASTARFDNIITASNRAADLCRQLLAYAGKGSFAIEHVNLNDIVTETARLLELTVSRHAVLEFALAAKLPSIEADPSQIRQVVMNLLLNASEAMGEPSGRIRLATQVIRLGSAEFSEAQLSSGLAPGDYVRLEITDTGSGMTPEVLEKIFDPFFSTKFTGRGLGLAAVLGIVRSHHGTLRVTSELGHGSTFRIFLPAAQGSSEHPFQPLAPTVRSASGPAGTVLVVDDEAPVRQLVMDVLKAGGYETIGAADGLAALEIFRVNPNRFACVLLDLTMPGLDGPKTLIAMKQLRPDVVGIIMSGYTEQDARASLADCGAVAFIQKPFTVETLYRKLAAARQT